MTAELRAGEGRPRLRRDRQVWIILLLLLGLAACLWFATWLVNRPRGRVTAFIDAPLHSILAADYSADPFSTKAAAVDVAIIGDVIGTDDPGRLATVVAQLGTPVPTITPRAGTVGPTEAASTPTNAPSAEPTRTPPPTTGPGTPSRTPAPTDTATATHTAVVAATLPPGQTATTPPTFVASATTAPSATNVLPTNPPPASNTPVPPASSTPVPPPSNTSPPPASNTPVPSATNTPVPPPTNTPDGYPPPPPPTNTPPTPAYP